jgi:putative transposase
MRRRANAEYIGPYRYSLTFGAFQRRPLFTNPQLVETATAQILRGADERAFSVLTYCFMPDHAHLLVDGSRSACPLWQFVKHAKQLSGYHGKKLSGEPVWQDGYYDRQLEVDDDPRDVAAYILMNPVRANLVRHPSEYPFSGSGCFSWAQLLEFARLSASDVGASIV